MLYRSLRVAAPASGDRLAALLRGDDKHPRSARACAHLAAILAEIGVVALDLDGAEPSLDVVDTTRTDLERSARYRACRDRLAAAEKWLGGAEAVPARAA